jgi:hypothetical protein
MISERKALTTKIEGDDFVITFDGDTPTLGAAQLLLDGDGRLVGVDLGGEGFGRVVVMLGPHEAVASQRAARVSVMNGALRIHGGKGLRAI